MKYRELPSPDPPPYPIAEMFKVEGPSQYTADYSRERFNEGTKPTFKSDYTHAVERMKISVEVNAKGDVTAEKRQKQKNEFQKQIDQQVQRTTKEYMDTLYKQFRHKQTVLKKKYERQKQAGEVKSRPHSAPLKQQPTNLTNTLSGTGGIVGRGLSPAATPIASHIHVTAPTAKDEVGASYDITGGDVRSFSPALDPVPGTLGRHSPCRSPYKGTTPRLTSRARSSASSIPPAGTPVPRVPHDFSVEAVQAFECPSPGPGPTFFDPDNRAIGVNFAPKFRQYNTKGFEDVPMRSLSADPMNATLAPSRAVRSATYRYEHPINQSRREMRQSFDGLTQSADASLPMAMLLQHQPYTTYQYTDNKPTRSYSYGGGGGGGGGDYMHQTSMFMERDSKTTNGPPYRSSFVIAPDWVSERMRPGKNISHMVSSKNPNSLRYGATKYS